MILNTILSMSLWRIINQDGYSTTVVKCTSFNSCNNTFNSFCYHHYQKLIENQIQIESAYLECNHFVGLLSEELWKSTGCSNVFAPRFKGDNSGFYFFFYHCAGLPSLEGCNDHVPMPSSIQVFKQEKNNALLFKGHVSSFSFLRSTSNCR